MNRVFRLVPIFLLFAVSFFNFTAVALDFTVNGLNYQLISAEEQTCRIISGNYSGEVIIPATVTYGGRELKVIEMANRTLCNTFDVTSVILGSNLQRIGENCLMNLNIETLTIPGSVTEIGDYSLSLSKLKKLVIEPPVYDDYRSQLKIGTFKDEVNLTTVRRPITQRLKSLETLEFYRYLICSEGGLFMELPLQSVIIGGSANPGLKCFYNCVNLQSVEFVDGYLLGIGDEAFYNCPIEGEFALPRELFGGVGARSFYGNHFSAIHLENVTSIGEEAFSGSKNITSIVIPEGISLIGANAFGSSPNLKNLKIETNCELKVGALGGNDYDIVTFTANCTQDMIAASLGAKKNGNICYSSPASMKELHVNAPVPPKQFVSFHGETFGFTEDQYVLTTLYVPAESIESYKSAEVWKNFWNIKADPNSSIDEVHVDDVRDVEKWYNLNGQLIHRPSTKGVYIRQINDKCTKVIVP